MRAAVTISAVLLLAWSTAFAAVALAAEAQSMVSVSIGADGEVRPFNVEQNMHCTCQEYNCSCRKECFCKVIEKSVAKMQSTASAAAKQRKPPGASYVSAPHMPAARTSQLTAQLCSPRRA
jgi:hypothetical protein